MCWEWVGWIPQEPEFGNWLDHLRSEEMLIEVEREGEASIERIAELSHCRVIIDDLLAESIEVGPLVQAVAVGVSMRVGVIVGEAQADVESPWGSPNLSD